MVRQRTSGFSPVLVIILLTMFLLANSLKAQEVEPQRVIEFSGQQWVVKSGCDKGPGPNCWSDSEESVYVDNQGQLHLKIRKIEGVWHTAEVVTLKPTHYGRHCFYTIGRLDNLDTKVVAAGFLYRDDQTEVDIEFTRWGNAEAMPNAQYAVQPAHQPGNLKPFPMSLNGDNSTHCLNWQPDSIYFNSIHGHHLNPPTDNHRIQQWYYTGEDVPIDDNQVHLHLNFWLFGNDNDPPSAGPTNGEEVEIIIKRVGFPRMINFAGREWIVKAGCDLQPGPNCWSDSNASVRVDEAGSLQLNLREEDGIWYAAEIFSRQPTDQGIHRFYTIGDLDTLDEKAVLGMMLRHGDQAEINIEYAQRNKADPNHNAQYGCTSQSHPFAIALTGTDSTHIIDWQSSRIDFKTIHGHNPITPTLEMWECTSAPIPVIEDRLHIYLNLWLDEGSEPANQKAITIAVTDIDFPLKLFLPIILKPSPQMTLTVTDDEAWGTISPKEYCSSDYKVALYAFVDAWYIMPTVNDPNIEIGADCRWQSTLNPWVQVAAHLVPVDYTPPTIISGSSCPPLDQMGEPVLASLCFAK